MNQTRHISLLKILLTAVLIAACLTAVCSAAPQAQATAEYRVETYSNGDQYAGYFLNGTFDGNGIYTWSNGDRYEGQFSNGQIHGYGRLTFFGTGQYWEGSFYYGGISSGTGIFYWGSNGDKFDGQWVNGQPDGTGILLHSNGTSDKVVFQNGQLVSYVGTTAGGNQSQYGSGYSSAPFANLRIGDIVSFGRYEQDNDYSNGSEAIQWRCLDIDERNHRALLLSVYGLETMAYHWDKQPVTWENCSLRSYLNSNFYNGVFNDSERQWIVQMWNNNPNSSAYETYGGNNTYDHVFLLSIDEVRHYFPNEGPRKAQPTAIARAHGAYGTADPSCAWWWLRSPGQNTAAASSINSLGVLLDTGPVVSDTTGMIRPAIWVNLGG